MMGKSNQQRIVFFLRFALVFGVLSLSQGLPFPGTSGSKRYGIDYGSPSSQNPSDSYTSDQGNAYSQDPSASNQDSTYSTSPDQQSSYQTSDEQSRASSYDQNAYSAGSSTASTEQSQSQDQSQSSQYGQSQTQSSQTSSDDSQTAQYDPNRSQTADSTSQSQGSYYTGTDQTSQTTPQNNGSQSSDYSGASQSNDAAQNNQAPGQSDPYATQGNQAAYQTNSSSTPAVQPSSDQQTSPDYSRYELLNVSSQTIPNPQDASNQANNTYSTVNVPSSSLSALGLPGNASSGYDATIRQGNGSPGSPVYLSSSDTASIANKAAPDSNEKSPSVSKETTMNGNHATTYLELPKHLHKPAIVKYQVQIAPKTKDVPIEQEIAIMPPEGTGGERKPLVLLKQTVSKPTDERIQIIVPKDDSSLVNSPKVEVKGGHVDQEDVNNPNESVTNANQGQTADQGQGASQGQGQSQGQPEAPGQVPSQGQVAAQGQVEGQDSLCHDLKICSHYNPTICDQEWMKRHCKKMCGLCSAEEGSFSPAPNNDRPSLKHCEYGGFVHQSGETWSPGPCIPKCECQDGFANCSKVECPDLNCDKPVKRRWKCCPECLPNTDKERRCGVDTSGGNAENLCCVFPFNYRGVDYFTCTAADSSEPWCSITRNFDRDRLWGFCVEKSKVESNHSKQTDSDEKSALLLAKQLSGARKWRNSTNSQVTDALKDMSIPKYKDQLRASKTTAQAYSGTTGMSKDTDGSYNGYPDQAANYNSSTWNFNDKTDNLNQTFDYNYNSSDYNYNTSNTTPLDSYDYGNNATEISKNSMSEGQSVQQSQDASASRSPTPTSATTKYDSGELSNSSPAEPYVSPYQSQSSNQQSTAAYDDRQSSEPVGTSSDSRSYNAGGSPYGASNAGTSYSTTYSQQSAAADTSDNVVPNGIEKQTSYEMNPDASTAQYASNQATNT